MNPKRKKKENKITKFSASDVQNSFLKIHLNTAEAEANISSLKSKGEPIHPFIICIGKDINNIHEILVYFDNIKYPIKSFIRALDLCFKIHMTFDIKFGETSELFWVFIYNFFYKMKKNAKFIQVNVLINDLENFEK